MFPEVWGWGYGNMGVGGLLRSSGTDRHGTRWRRKERALPSENQSSFGGSDEKRLEKQVKGVRSARLGVLRHSTPWGRG